MPAPSTARPNLRPASDLALHQASQMLAVLLFGILLASRTQVLSKDEDEDEGRILKCCVGVLLKDSLKCPCRPRKARGLTFIYMSRDDLVTCCISYNVHGV